MSARFAGIDVGARTLHAAVLEDGEFTTTTFAADDLDSLIAWIGKAERIAVDAPDALSTRPHADDHDLPSKFKAARCGEIALGRERGVWVSWVPPAEPPIPPWMQTGLNVHANLTNTVETYPHATFLALAGSRLPPKRTAGGRAARAELIGIKGDHDTLDAAAAALAARDGTPVTCGHDGSAIWTL